MNDGLIRGDGHGPEGVSAEDAARFDLRGNEAINLVGDYEDFVGNSSTGRIIGGISMGGAGDTLNNSGSIIATGGSAIDMGAGNDQVNLYVGATVTGKILLGTGDDVALHLGWWLRRSMAATAAIRWPWTTHMAVLTSSAAETATTTSMPVQATIRSMAGLTTIRSGGNDGDDLIKGGSGNDDIAGGIGADTIHGDGGNDSIDGGEGNDTVFYTGTFNQPRLRVER